MLEKTMVRSLLTVALLASAVSAQADVFKMGGDDTSLSFVTVGNPGNAADPATGYGAVLYTYQMGTYDVTTAQYVAFLNAVATKSDPCGLYNPGMATDYPTIAITRNGSAPNYSYAVTGSDSQGVNCPIFDVSWGDAARFCNWLQNGQPTSGTEAVGTTETGAYNLITSSGTGATTNAALMAVTRSSTATYFIPSENEWYKAAYYDTTLNGSAGGYWTYPTRSDTPPGNTLPDTGNNANSLLSNYADPTNHLTPVGDFNLSPGPYGTYDMGGDVLQWDEANIDGLYRGIRGGWWYLNSSNMASSTRFTDLPLGEGGLIAAGFRVASSVAVPEPSSIAMLLAGTVALGIWRLRRKA